MTTYICTLYYPPLPSETIKRPRQHSVAIQTTPTLFAFRRGQGSTGGGVGRAARTDEEYVHLYSHTISIYPTPPTHPPSPHLHPPPFTLSHCAEYKYPVQVQKVARGGGKRRRGGGVFMYIFVFGLIFFSCVLSLRRKIQPVI